MASVFWGTGIVFLLVFGRLTCAQPPSGVSLPGVCPRDSLTDSILQNREFRAGWDSSPRGCDYGRLVEYIEEDEVSFQQALNLLHKNSDEYVSLFFYASWCPFSKTFKPTFTVLSSLYPSICHFAVEESAIKPSMLTRYGVHGFPTLFLVNSTTRIRYQGSRTLNSLVAFYGDVTGIRHLSPYPASVNTHWELSKDSKLVKFENVEQESCPFSWARSPENLLRQETYLALATIFVLLRLLHFLLPMLLTCSRCVWRRHARNVSLVRLWEHPLSYFKKSVQVFNTTKQPFKRRNLKEGAFNARAWASNSLASVSIGDTTPRRGCLGSE